MIRENDEESIATEKKDDDELDSDEELGRSEERINLEHVSVKSNSSAKQKAILSPDEVKKITSKAEQEERKAALEDEAIKLNMRTQ